MTPDHADQAHEPLRARRLSGPLSSASQNEPAAILPDHISQNIAAIKALHARADETLSRYQRPRETVGMLLGRPTFFYGIVLFVAVWVLSNVFSPRLGIAPFDLAPYHWLQGIVGLGAWLTATIVLMTQTRQGKLAEQQAQLDLQVSLLAEQKTATLIALIDELRRDLPNVDNRHDPQAMLSALEETLQEPVQEVASPEKPDTPEPGAARSPARR